MISFFYLWDLLTEWDRKHDQCYCFKHRKRKKNLYVSVIEHFFKDVNENASLPSQTFFILKSECKWMCLRVFIHTVCCLFLVSVLKPKEYSFQINQSENVGCPRSSTGVLFLGLSLLPVTVCHFFVIWTSCTAADWPAVSVCPLFPPLTSNLQLQNTDLSHARV